MFVRMCWKEAQKKFDAREDFSITCGNHAHPYEPCFYARDYYVGKYDFMTTLEVLSIYNDASVNCWKQVPEGTEEPKEGKLLRMTVWDKVERSLATAYMRAVDVEAAKQEAHDRYYEVMEIEEV